jgi:hypothetical protein
MMATRTCSAVANAMWTIVGSFPSHARVDLLVSARFGNNVLRYADGTGASQGQFNMVPPLSNSAELALDQAETSTSPTSTRTRCSNIRPAAHFWASSLPAPGCFFRPRVRAQRSPQIGARSGNQGERR